MMLKNCHAEPKRLTSFLWEFYFSWWHSVPLHSTQLRWLMHSSRSLRSDQIAPIFSSFILIQDPCSEITRYQRVSNTYFWQCWRLNLHRGFKMLKIWKNSSSSKLIVLKWIRNLKLNISWKLFLLSEVGVKYSNKYDLIWHKTIHLGAIFMYDDLWDFSYVLNF